MSIGANKRVVMISTAVVIGMMGLGFASKPLYDTFCRVTGYGGTTQVADTASDTVIDRDIIVRFDSNINPDLKWSFKPVESTMTVKLGQNALAFYTAKNISDAPLVGTASYNVAPIKAAPFFSKLECFCFTEQRLEPGEEVKMPVLFFVDPEMANDDRYDDIKTITLSYTFHKVEAPTAAALTTEDRTKKLEEITALELTQ
ncbi:MAG: cytochrome c oxidase assembly protein [Acidimicrobiales bacterium]|nr:cytochrome c oxidase assembly protein [Hyphomonadaceae bacterium]RZV38417.1 MAG: cytochrome c oxidase assembly protein [Acidimicrobiales bacterium]